MTTVQQLMVARNNSDSMNLYPSQLKNVQSDSRYSTDSYISNRNHDLESMILQEKMRSNELQERKKSRISRLTQLPDQIPEMATKPVNAQFFPLRGSQIPFRGSDMDIERDQTPKTKTGLKRGLLNSLSRNSTIRSEKIGFADRLEYNDEYNLPTLPTKMHSKRQSNILNIHPTVGNVKSTKGSIGSFSMLNQQKMNFNQAPVFPERQNDDHYLADTQLSAQVSVSNEEYPQYQTQKQQQQQISRNNTLYKFLNSYFSGTDPKALKTAPSQQKIQRIPHIPSQENMISTDVPSADNSSGVSLTSETDSQFNGMSKSSTNQHSSSSLRNKLAETLKTLPTSTRMKEMTEKTKKRNDKKIWTTQKDHLLKLLVHKLGQNWEAIASEMQDPQIDSQGVRERFAATLKLEDRKAKFSLQEDETIAKYHKIHGSNWKLIAKHLPGRTEAMVRKRFHSTIKRKMNLEEDVGCQKGDKPSEEKEEKPQDQVVSANPIQEEDNQEIFNKGSNFDDFRFENANPFPDYDHIDYNFPGTLMKEDTGIQSSNQFGSDLFIPEFDIFAGGPTSDSIERKNNEMEIDCSSPIIDSALPVEWGNHHLAFSDEKPQKENQFFDMLDQPVERKLNFEDESYWNNLIDFNQEPIIDKNLTLEQNSICSKEEKVEQTQPQQQPEAEKDKSELMNAELNKAMSAVLQLGMDKENSGKIHLLMSQIKSIEMLFNLTRKEIHKLQNEFGK